VWQGSKDTLIVEACEHRAHMLNLRPDIIVLTNIEFDHPDYYRDLDHVVETFQQYVDQLPQTGVLIYNLDDVATARLDMDCQAMAYSQRLLRPTVSDRRQLFTLPNGVEFSLQIPGDFNVANALACIMLTRYLHIPDPITQRVLADFTGVWRRFQVLGETPAGAVVISDYAHHPTAVAATMTAAREFYPDRRLVAVFQPHQRTRTQELLTEFVNCFQQYVQPQDKIIIAEIYDVAGREESSVVLSSRELVEKIHLPQVIYAPDLDTAHMIVDEVIEPTDVVLVMGAGDVYRVAEELAIRH
jgi:UDP-N-acetylmuramate--alanine ligase